MNLFLLTRFGSATPVRLEDVESCDFSTKFSTGYLM